MLPPGLASEPARLPRFHNEVRLARQVSHPNVCRVHDIGEASRVEPLREADGTISGCIGVARDVTESRQAARAQACVYRIAEAAPSALDLTELFRSIHKVIGELVPARNFYIALFDAENQTLSFPYFADENDPTPAPKPPGAG